MTTTIRAARAVQAPGDVVPAHSRRPWEDDEPGQTCSACDGYGTVEAPNTGREYECRPCAGEGVAP